ncbi:hypothetical protein G7Y89_g610 [Cudoniella acicularis]|uniref:Extracellular membrane protein CFEM domain-containing protein n=1 Tax=Cudoniella acicularis TaxID=354080 RepID=A0A8H4RXU6_9HELO|nr:hypothetical protein G7Y89_g610 [Cudoniella acicularis]
MSSSKMLLVLPTLTLLQVLGVSASFENVFFPRSPAGEIIANAAAVLGGGQIVARQIPQGCSYALFAVSFCDSVSPGFSTMNPTLQAPCLCYSSTAWIPDIFDSAMATCASYAKTADTSDYSSLKSLEGFCSSVGPVLAITTSAAKTTPKTTTATRPASTAAATTAAITSAAATTGALTDNPGCVTVGSLISSCSVATQGFTDMPDQSQAACLCYKSGSFVSTSFDNAALSCANYAKTADPTDYSVVQGLEGFCSSVGPVSTTGAVVSAPTGSTTPLTGNGSPSTSSTANAGLPVVTKTIAPTTPSTGGNGAVTVTASTTKTGSAPELTNNAILALVSLALSMALLF